MGTLVESDIDQFIRSRKNQLENERNQLSDQVRYHANNPTVTSPAGRKQWDKEQSKGARLAEEQRAPPQQQQNGVPMSENEQNLRKQQLQSERQREYNEMVANKPGQGRNRRPRTPSNEGLPLGQHEAKRKALEQERTAEMKQAMAKPNVGRGKAGLFDYKKAEKQHMEEKRREYNDYLVEKGNMKRRHIVTPEQGMFVGPDQSDRDKQIRERNLANKITLEKQYQHQMLRKARQAGEIFQTSPRQNPPAQNNNQAFRPVPQLEIPENIDDKSSLSPRYLQTDQQPSTSKEHVSTKLPIYRENEVQGHSKENDLGRHPGHDRGRDRERGHRLRIKDDMNDREKYQWYNERKLSPPLDVRRSRSFSPPHERRRSRSPDDRRLREMMEDYDKPPKTRAGRLRVSPRGPVGYDEPQQGYRLTEQEKVQRMYDEQMAQKQQVLQEDYQRQLAEDQRVAADQERNQNNNFGEDRQKQLGEERKQEYQEFLARRPPKLSLREKEVTPENLRQGLPLDQRRHDSERETLNTERKKEYNELLQKQAPLRQKVATPEERGLDIGQYENTQRHLSDERKQEYNNKLAEKSKLPNRVWKEPEEETFQDKFGLDDGQRGKLQDEKRRAYRKHVKQQQQQSRNRRSDVLEGTAGTLPVGEYDNSHRRQQLDDERHNDYLQHQQQKLGTERRQGLPPKPPTPNHFFKNIGEHDKQRDKLNEERKKEYNQKQSEGRGRTGAHRGPPGAEPPGGLQINRSERSDSSEDKNKDTYATLAGLHYSDSPEIRKMKARNDEYNDFLREKQFKDAHRLDNKKPPTAAEQRRHSLPSSPRKNPRGKRQESAAGLLPGLSYSDSAEKRKIQERNREYNDFLKEKEGGPRKGWATPTYEDILEQKRREEAMRREEDEYAPAGMRNYASEGALNRLETEFKGRALDKDFEARKVRFEEERKLANTGGILEDDNWLRKGPGQEPEHREQEFQQLPDQVPEREDMAARVRQPNNFLASLPVGGTPGLNVGGDERESAKRRKQADYRRELQLQMEESKAAKRREKVQGLTVNASGLLDPEKNSNRMRGLGGETTISPRREYRAADVQPYHTKIMYDDSGADYDALGMHTGGSNVPIKTAGGSGFGHMKFGGQGSGEPEDMGRPPPPLHGILANGGFGNGGFGNVASGDDLRFNLGDGGGGGRSDRGRRRDRDTSILGEGFQGLLESRRKGGPSSIPPGLMYEPSIGLEAERPPRMQRMVGPVFPGIYDLPSANPLSDTYVTGASGGLRGGLSSVDEAYMFFGMKDPLDANVGTGRDIPNLNLGGGGNYGGDPSYGRSSPTPRVTFADDPPTSHRKRDRSRERISPYQFPSDDDNRSRSRNEVQNYGAELERQIAEKRYRKQLEKEEQQRYDRKLEEDIKNYNPFGKGGGGAPIRDAGGKAVADLRSIQRNEGGAAIQQPTPRRASPAYSPRPPSPRDDKFGPPPAQQNAIGDPTYARGGHGIFGQPKTEAEKDSSDKYKDDLREQINEKRRREQMEKDKEKMEEEKENRRLEEQRIRMQEEYEQERRKVQAREEEARQRNEELKKQADDKKKEADRKRREADDARMKEQNEQIEKERQDRERRNAEAADRLKSPPVPAVRVKGVAPTSSYNYYAYYQDDDQQRGKSPPLPAHRAARESPPPRSRASQRSQRSQQPSPAPGPSIERPNSSDVLTQLASMRKQLQSERKRVENALENSKNEPDVFDPRTIQRPPPNKLVFENAVRKNASLPPPRATSETANATNIQQFNKLKFKSDSESRRAFRSMFPEAPITNNTLEAQQDAMLRQQEEQLRGMKDRRNYRPSSAPQYVTFERGTGDDISLESILDPYDPSPSTRLGYGNHGNTSARSHLPSNSAFIDVDGVNHFPEDFEDMAGTRNDSARARRRDRYSPRGVSAMNGMGSQASIDVDRIQRKNEDRLRNLHHMTAGDDVSIGDPDDILERFMAKQRYNRPPSGQTLQDDSWLRPGSKVM